MFNTRTQKVKSKKHTGLTQLQRRSHRMPIMLYLCSSQKKAESHLGGGGFYLVFKCNQTFSILNLD